MPRQLFLPDEKQLHPRRCRRRCAHGRLGRGGTARLCAGPPCSMRRLLRAGARITDPAGPAARVVLNVDALSTSQRDAATTALK